MDITTKVASLTLSNPLLPGSGPLTGDDERMTYLAKLGLGALVTKTVAPEGAVVGRPCIIGTKNMIANSEAWSEYGSDEWVDKFLPNTKKNVDTPIIVSIGYDEADMKNLIPRLEPFAAGYEYIPRYIGKNFDEVQKVVATARKLTEKPIWVKMNANISDPVGFAKACNDSGANGIVAITSLGPNMVIDIENRKPVIGIDSGYVWTSGPPIKPLALAYVNMIKEAYPNLSVIGCGGVANADDVIEFLLAGADAVQMLSEAMLKGRDLYKKIIEDLPKRLEKYGFESIEDVKRTGLTKKKVATEPSYPVVDHEKCTVCGICEKNCPYFAITNESGKIIINQEKCFGCGLCESRCPVKAIKGVL
ncbi:4Fe-4S binding protein [Clostridium sediminicola]|uniref:4Fe-4S binding protein n=1 Tax=Clostridium sediminicola TaxID=3114879 RepID=UPI0031F22648